MPLSIVRQSPADLDAYGAVPIAFTVARRWKAGTVDPPFIKDYDALPQNRPIDWAQRFDLTGWRFAAAFFEGVRVGGVAVVLKGSEVDDTAQPQDAALWDLRVRFEYRRHGAGRKLLQWAENEARSAGRNRIVIETQDINAVACEFYAANGYSCLKVDPSAYPELPGEAQVLLVKMLCDRCGRHTFLPPMKRRL